MADKMLIDASHEEETRVVVVRGNRIEEFDFESQHKKQLRGNIYLAKVTRVEPSLQAAFVDYGGNRHGFLAFSEIHPDYYQIPLADREALLNEERHADSDDDDAISEPTEVAEKSEKESAPKPRTRRGRAKSRTQKEVAADAAPVAEDEQPSADDAEKTEAAAPEAKEETAEAPAKKPRARRKKKAAAAEGDATKSDAAPEESDGSADAETTGSDDSDDKNGPTHMAAEVDADTISEDVDDDDDDDDNVESVGAEDAMEEVPENGHRRLRKQYRIQEVIKRRQILLVQVAKEERGNKGAALTTYLSLAGRYSVLMPNTARGGGISRKITNPTDRKRLKEVAKGLEVPQGMGVILRTAGANRTKAEVKRDFEYLMRLWENVRSKTLTSTAPCLVYEEGSLIKRSIRDLYNKDIDEIIVSGEEGYREAKDFMKMLMPSHAKVVQPYRDVHPIYSRSGIEAQLDRMLQPQVTLKSGGYLIINQTEALVAVDVNSGRSTREHSIEDTALQTNLEAAEEVARQLRLRDLAGLVVIDFIDMEEKRNNRAVEKKLKECLKNDRARIQVGRISHFGLMEMSRQRIRASVLESTTQVCSHCGGTGHVLSQSSVALHVLRGIEEYLLKNTTHNICVTTTPDIALYVLNHKRNTIVDYESRFGVEIMIESTAELNGCLFEIERREPVENPVKIEALFDFKEEIEDIEPEVEELPEEEEQPEAADDANRSKRKRRRRRRGNRGGQNNGAENGTSQDNGSEAETDDSGDSEDAADTDEANASSDDQPRRKRRRGKRGGRRNRSEDNDDQASESQASEARENAASEDGEAAETQSAEAVATTESVASEPVTTDDAAGQAETADEAQPEAVAETAVAEEPVAEKKPKRRRRKAADKEEKAEAAAEPAAEPLAADTEEGEAMAVIEGRQPKTAKPKDEADASKAEPVVSTPPGFSEAETVAPVADMAATSEADVAQAEPVEAAAPAEADAAEPEEAAMRANRGAATSSSEPVVTSSGSNDDEQAKPKRGWWNRRGFF